jgi:glutamate-ammonia-ligase adenylyltransferase
LAEHYLCQLPDGAALLASLHELLNNCGPHEADQMIALRNFKHSHVLHIVSLDLEGLLSLEEVSKALSQLADLLLECVLERVSKRMGLGTKPPLGIIGYGKLGSREMTYASDTDIVFLYDEKADIPEAKLTRLARCVNQWLTEPTTAGVLYATDFRLRPYGESGLLITSTAAFREYQRRHAWIWEHQALTRARWIAGESTLGEQFQCIRHEMLVRERDPQQLCAEVLAMRDRISEAHQESGDTFNVKRSRGGIIDVEFAVQHLVLRHAAEHPELVSYTDNESVLSAAARLGLIPATLAAAANEAFRQYRKWMHSERLRGNEVILLTAQKALAYREAVCALWQHVFGVRALFGETAQPAQAL